jgi:hypothetical protein
MAGNSFAQQRTPLDVCMEVAASQSKEIVTAKDRITVLQEQTANQEATIKMWENKSSGKLTRGDKWKLGLTITGSVAAIVGTVIGR